MTLPKRTKPLAVQDDEYGVILPNSGILHICEEVCRFLRIHPSTLYRGIAAGRYPAPSTDQGWPQHFEMVV